MKAILTIILAAMTFITAGAYKYSYTFDNVPVSEAIVKISKENPEVNISFIYKELDRYLTCARVRTDDAFDALRSVVGIHPISIIRRGDNYYIEAMQRGDYTLRGRVVDTDAEPLAAAVVYIVSADGLRQITYGFTDGNGCFEIPCDSKDVTLRTSYLGYEDFAMSVPHSGNCGVITLNPKVVALREVTVKSGRPVTAIKGDALVTTVEGTQLEHAGTAEDVLAQVPMVLARDGSVEVFGKGSPSIYVNGRQIMDMTELSMISSSDIKRVEVVTNPGARYDGSVKSVIRIFTRRPQGEGFSATLRATGIMRDYGQSVNNARLKYRTGGLEVFANIAGGVGKFDGKQDMEMLTNTTIRWDQSLDRNGTLHLFDCLGQAGFSYLLNDNHSIGAHYNQHYTNSKSDYFGLTTVHADEEFYDKLQLNSVDQSRTLPSHYTNLYYSGKVGELSIDFNTDYMWRKITNPVTETELSAMHESTEINSCGVSRSRMFAEKLILSYPLWKGTVEVGEEYTSSRFSSDYITDAEIVNNADSRVNENNIAAFLELRQSFGRFNIVAGLRYEHVKFDYLENGTRQSEQSKTYNNLFPSLSFATTAGNVQLSLNYSHKTQRPSYSDLDGSIGYINRFTLDSGNPYLKPEKIHSVELTGAWRQFFAQLSYICKKDPVMRTSRPYSESGEIKLLTMENFPEIQSLRAFVGSSFKIGVWEPRVNLGITKQWLSMDYMGKKKRLDNPVGLVQWQNAIHIPGDLWLNVDLQWMSAGNEKNSYQGHSSFIDARLYKAFFNNSFSISAQANDIFNTRNYGVTMMSGDVTLYQCSRSLSRSFVVTLQYTFNSSRDRYKGKGAGTNEKNRF